jgi:hypothetical protein
MKADYDSTADTLTHIRRVQELLNRFAIDLIWRGEVHDKTKLVEPEKSAFDISTPKLKELTFGTPEYQQSLDELKPALDHHYEHNSHHPQHYEQGINGMDLFDLLEMMADWKAAGERTKNGDIYKSLEINKARFNISDQLYEILKKTVIRYLDDSPPFKSFEITP